MLVIEEVRNKVGMGLGWHWTGIPSFIYPLGWQDTQLHDTQFVTDSCQTQETRPECLAILFFCRIGFLPQFRDHRPEHGRRCDRHYVEWRGAAAVGFFVKAMRTEFRLLTQES